LASAEIESWEGEVVFGVPSSREKKNTNHLSQKLHTILQYSGAFFSTLIILLRHLHLHVVNNIGLPTRISSDRASQLGFEREK